MSEEKERTILVYDILRIHPRVVTVKLADDVQAVLPIKTPMYNKLVDIVNYNPREQRWYPLVFWLDEKGYVTDLLPYKTYKKRKAEEETEAKEEETGLSEEEEQELKELSVRD